MKPNFTTGNVLLIREQSKGNILPQRYKKSQALKDLETLSFEAKRLRYPCNPYLTGDQFEDKTAGGLTRSIIAWIRLKGGQAERINTTGRPIDRTQTFTDVTGRSRTIGRIEWIKGTGTNGSADISAIVKGRSIKIEVKIKTDRQSQVQKEYQKQVETAGGLYVIARDFETFIQWYEQRFKP
jgi:hypothetical protein